MKYGFFATFAMVLLSMKTKMFVINIQNLTFYATH